MLEQKLRDYFQEMAAPELAPGPVSLSAAAKRGRARKRLRRASIIGAPAFAAVSVLAIALAATGLTGTGPGPAATPSLRAPRHFSLLRPYAWFDEPPQAQMSVDESLTALQETLLYSTPQSQTSALTVQAAARATSARAR